MGRRRGLLVIGLAAALMAAGCASTEKKLEADLRHQAELIDSLSAESQKLQSQLQQTQQGLASAQQQSASAEAELANLRRKLAAGSGPAPAVSARIDRAGTKSRVRFTLESKVLFSLGKSELTSEGQRALRRVASVIKSDFPGRYVRIEGHTDSVPVKTMPGKTNLELSNERAEAVWHYLVNHCGVDAKMLYTAGYAQYRPVQSNRTELGRQSNRRVEIVVVDE